MRFKNTISFEQYCKGDFLDPKAFEVLTEQDYLIESFFLGLRTDRGVRNLEHFAPILVPNYLEKISELILSKLHQEYLDRTGENAREEDIFKGATYPDESNFKNFLITENGITFLFPAGQVSCHAMGAWSIEISYSELKDLLKDGIPKIYLE